MADATTYKDILKPITENLVSEIFGRLTIVSFSHYSKQQKPFWEAKCECGKTITISSVSLKQYQANSCGCIKRQKITNPNIHGLSNNRIFKIWTGMIQRCYNPKAPKFEDYGGRGIIVCERWLFSFQNFANDMRLPPSNGHTLDRKEVNGNYEPLNCKWSTRKEQQRNKRDTVKLTIHGMSAMIDVWSNITGVKKQTIITRYYRGYSDYECIYGKNTSILN